MFGRGAEPDPFVTEAGLNAGSDHGIQFLPGGFVADAVLEVAIGAHLLHRGKTAAFVVHARYTVTGEHLRNVGEAARSRVRTRRLGRVDALAASRPDRRRSSRYR